MKNFKNVVAAGLALLMLALSVNVTFAAEEYSEKEAIVVAKVNAAGIMTGTDKGFEPSKTLTRAEAAAIFVRMKGISEDTVKQNATTTLFTDVAASHWAAGYVNVASNYGIIKGVGANKFAPEKEVTVAEFYTMAIRALNAGQLVEAEGTWPTNYVNFAIENDLAEDVAQIYTAASTRLTAATIVANTLEAEMWKKQGYKSNGEVEFRPSGETILDALNIKEYTLAKIESVNTKDGKASVVDSREDDPFTTLSSVKFNERANLASAKAGIKYTVWYDTNEKEVLGFWVPDDDTSVVTFTDVKKFKDSDAKVVFIIDGEEKEYKLNNAKLYLNGFVPATAADEKPFTASSLATEVDGSKNNVFGTAYLDSEDKVTAVYAEVYTNMEVVKEVKDERIIFESETDVKGSTTGVSTIVYDKDEEYTILKNGKELKFEDIEEGDVLFYYVIDDTNDKYFINVYEETVEGKVSAVNSTKNTVKIGGTVYDCDAELPNAGAEIKAYLAEDGDIAMYEIIEDETNFAVISAIKKETSNVADEGVKIYAKFTDTKENLTDWIEIKLSACVSTLQSDSAWTAATSDKYNLLGSLVEYSLDGGKAVVSTLVANNNGYAYKEKGQKLTKSNSTTYYLTDSTVVLELEVEDASKDFSKTLMNAKVVDVADLDDLADTDIKAYGDIDDIYVGVIVLNNSNIKAEKNWGVVLSKSNWSDDDDATNYNALYEIQLKGSTSAVELVSDKALTVGGIYEIATGTATIDGEEVEVIKTAKENTKVGTLGPDDNEFADKAEDAIFVGKKNDNNTVSFVTLSSLTVGASAYTDTYKLADDVIVVKDKDAAVGVAAQGQTPANAHLDLEASKLTSLVDLGAKPTETISQGVADKAKSVGTVYTYTDGDVEEIIAIIYID